MKPTQHVAWEALADGYLVMRLDTGDMIRLHGAAAEVWAAVVRGEGDDSLPNLAEELHAWGALTFETS